MIFVFSFLLGLIIGSFLNALIFRLKSGEGMVSARSHCVHCGKTLAWEELIPVLSFIIQRGRCTNCHKKISWQYPVVELATGFLFLFAAFFSVENLGNFLNWNVSAYAELLINWFYVSVLVVVFMYDYKHYIIPNKVVYPAIIVALSYKLVFFIPLSSANQSAISLLSQSLLSAFGAAGFFFLLILISGGKWMGMGDVKLTLFMGLALGWPGIFIALYFAFITGAVVGIILILKGQKKIGAQIPFGPFLASGTVFAMFFSDIIVQFIQGYYFPL